MEKRTVFPFFPKYRPCCFIRFTVSSCFLPQLVPNLSFSPGAQTQEGLAVKCLERDPAGWIDWQFDASQFVGKSFA